MSCGSVCDRTSHYVSSVVRARYLSNRIEMPRKGWEGGRDPISALNPSSPVPRRGWKLVVGKTMTLSPQRLQRVTLGSSFLVVLNLPR